MAALDEVDGSGDAAPGCCRLQTEDGNATAVQASGWDVADSHGVIVDRTTWTSVQALADFESSGQHLAVMRRRRGPPSARAAPARRALRRLVLPGLTGPVPAGRSTAEDHPVADTGRRRPPGTLWPVLSQTPQRSARPGGNGPSEPVDRPYGRHR